MFLSGPWTSHRDFEDELSSTLINNSISYKNCDILLMLLQYIEKGEIGSKSMHVQYVCIMVGICICVLACVCISLCVQEYKNTVSCLSGIGFECLDLIMTRIWIG